MYFPLLPACSYPVSPFIPTRDGVTFVHTRKLDFSVFSGLSLVLTEIGLNLDDIPTGETFREECVVGGEDPMVDPCDILPCRPIPRCAIRMIEFNKSTGDCMAGHFVDNGKKEEAVGVFYRAMSELTEVGGIRAKHNDRAYLQPSANQLTTVVKKFPYTSE